MTSWPLFCDFWLILNIFFDYFLLIFEYISNEKKKIRRNLDFRWKYENQATSLNMVWWLCKYLSMQQNKNGERASLSSPRTFNVDFHQIGTKYLDFPSVCIRNTIVSGEKLDLAKKHEKSSDSPPPFAWIRCYGLQSI